MILASLGIIAGKGGTPSTLLNGLVSAYNAENNTNDSLGTNNGTGVGGLTYTTGKINQAFNLNGTTSYVDMGDVMDVGTSSWTYSFWFNTNSLATTTTLFGKTIAAGVRGRVFCQLDGNKLVVGFDADASNVIIVETPTLGLSTGTWYNVVVQIDRSDKLKVYINNSLITLTTTNGTNNLVPYSATNYNANNPFRIGAFTSADNVSAFQFFNGKIDVFNVWNRVLIVSEISELFNSGNGKQYPF
jgi:hypothetical protein